MNARITYQIVVQYQDVADVLAKFSAISLQADIDGWKACFGPEFSICEDTTVENPIGSGILQRVVKLSYSPEFMQQFPDATSKKENLRYFGLGILRTQLPGNVTSSGMWEENDCPPPPP